MIKISGLAYVVAESADPAKWQVYGEAVLGMMSRPAPNGGLYLKMDERQFRIAVQHGSRDAYIASGWELRQQSDFDAAVLALQDIGLQLKHGDAALCQLRCVQQLVAFADPSGNRHELVWGYKSDFAHFASPVGVAGFVTGDMGMGHVVLPAPNFEATKNFFCEVLGFGLSDLMNFRPAGPDGPSLPIHFLHCGNERHHSLALAGFPAESGCVHLMVEVQGMAEVGRAMDRMQAHGVRQSATLGQHTNDHITSFYMQSPSSFDIEYGYGGRRVDWERHVVDEFTRVSLWGHDFQLAHKEA